MLQYEKKRVTHDTCSTFSPKGSLPCTLRVHRSNNLRVRHLFSAKVKANAEENAARAAMEAKSAAEMGVESVIFGSSRHADVYAEVCPVGHIAHKESLSNRPVAPRELVVSVFEFKHLTRHTHGVSSAILTTYVKVRTCLRFRLSQNSRVQFTPCYISSSGWA